MYLSAREAEEGKKWGHSKKKRPADTSEVKDVCVFFFLHFWDPLLTLMLAELRGCWIRDYMYVSVLPTADIFTCMVTL